MCHDLITIKNCRIENSKTALISELSWKFSQGQSWLVIGPNGGGKADFLNALSGSLKIIPNEVSSNGEASLFSSIFADSVEIVSLERAAKLIQEERENDESDYVEGGVDIGRTGRIFIAEGILSSQKDPFPAVTSDFKAQVQANKAVVTNLSKQLDSYPEIKLCGVQNILDRGIKYMSTGEIRRTLLARALLSGKKLLILSDPFAGLDVESRGILLDFFDTISKKQLEVNDSALADDSQNFNFPHIILGMERWHEIPSSISHVVEFTSKQISFCGTRQEYEAALSQKQQLNSSTDEKQAQQEFSNQLSQTLQETIVLQNKTAETSESDSTSAKEVLVEMNNVNVGWDGHQVLKNLNWKLYKGEHWLVRGPNGSGKTTFLELVTGDNMQVYSNDVRLFGIKRGSGETIWDIKQKLGIVSYRLHVEYRMLGGTSLVNVIVSGFRDSIGLYGAATDVETTAAKKWLKLGGFEGREYESFGNLSYGEQRAVLILRSAVKSPQILILDEPCHGLDEQYRNKILNLMNLIGNGGTTTMLHVTHDPSEVLECEKHILELHPNEDPMYKIIEK